MPDRVCAGCGKVNPRSRSLYCTHACKVKAQRKATGTTGTTGTTVVQSRAAQPEKAKRHEVVIGGVVVGTQGDKVKPWLDLRLTIEERRAAAQKEADRAGYPIVFSNARGLVARPAKGRNPTRKFGPPMLSVQVTPYIVKADRHRYDPADLTPDGHLTMRAAISKQQAEAKANANSGASNKSKW